MKEHLDKKFKTNLYNLVKNTSFEIEQYEYFPKVFGNFIIVLRREYKSYKFITDKGDIYLNDYLIITNQDCMKIGKSTFDAILDKVEDLIKSGK